MDAMDCWKSERKSVNMDFIMFNISWLEPRMVDSILVSKLCMRSSPPRTEASIMVRKAPDCSGVKPGMLLLVMFEDSETMPAEGAGVKVELEALMVIAQTR